MFVSYMNWWLCNDVMFSSASSNILTFKSFISHPVNCSLLHQYQKQPELDKNLKDNHLKFEIQLCMTQSKHM